MDVRPGYRQTEAGVIPTDWEVRPLAELFTFQNGVNADKSAYGTGVRFINVLEVISHSFINEERIPGKISLSPEAINAFAVRQGDILFNRTSETQEEVGLASVYTGTETVVFGGFVIRARTRDNKLNPGFLAYALRSSSIRSQIVARGQGAVRSNIGQRELSRVYVGIPAEAEQDAITDALNDAEALIESLEQLLVKKRQLKQAAMEALLAGKKRLLGFTGEWKQTRLGELGTTYGGLTGKSKRHFGHGSSRYITFMNVMANTVIDSGHFAAVDVDSREQQNRVAKGDLFFNGSSETPEEVGLCAVLTDDVERVFLNSFCFGFRFRDATLAVGLYLAYYFRSQEGRGLLKSLAQGATRYNLSKSAFLEIRVSLPSSREQVAIAAILSDMDAEIDALEAKLDKARLIKQGMMQELLTGRIRLV